VIGASVGFSRIRIISTTNEIVSQTIRRHPNIESRDPNSNAADEATVELRRVRHTHASTSGTYENGDCVDSGRNADERTTKCCLSVHSGTERHSTGHRKRLTATSHTPEPLLARPCLDQTEEIRSTAETRSPPISRVVADDASRMSSTLPATTTPNGASEPNRTGSFGTMPSAVASGGRPFGNPRRGEQPNRWTSDVHRPIIIAVADDEFDNIGRAANDDDDAVEAARRRGEEDEALSALLQELTAFGVEGRGVVGARNHQTDHHYVDLRS